MSHVNLMTDTVIANLPPDGLRTVLRALLTTNPDITPVLEQHLQTYLQRTPGLDWREDPAESFPRAIEISRVMLGCGVWPQSLHLMSQVLNRIIQLDDLDPDLVNSTLSVLNVDIIQAVTAIEKTQNARQLLPKEIASIEVLFESLRPYSDPKPTKIGGFPLDRSTRAVAGILGHSMEASSESYASSHTSTMVGSKTEVNLETFNIGGRELPRLFTGLWQLSSPAWGVASTSEVFRQFQEYAAASFTAYDMADHYGDAEVIFGNFKSSYSDTKSLFASTKLCIFRRVAVTPEFISGNVTERCRRLSSESVDLLQLHWQFYDDHQYIDALRLLQKDKRIASLGLCNFDTERMEEILAAGIDIVSNQVQFSLIDSRPTVRMGAVSEAHNVKLLTYGTLCGGFIAEKWLDEPEPELFSKGITPSQRKYFDMIKIWGGWTLFQELLRTLRGIATKHKVSISNVATRWVLDFPYVGAVLVGARMGISEHIEDNLRCYGWKLDDEDRRAIDTVLERSNAQQIHTRLGDCGGEYRR